MARASENRLFRRAVIRGPFSEPIPTDTTSVVKSLDMNRENEENDAQVTF